MDRRECSPTGTLGRTADGSRPGDAVTRRVPEPKQRRQARQSGGREVEMSLNRKHALITGSSRGIGRGIALKLAEQAATVAIHYYQNESAATRP